MGGGVKKFPQICSIQRWPIRRALGCEKFLPDPAWLLLSKTGPSFSPSLYNFASFYACQSRRARCEHWGRLQDFWGKRPSVERFCWETNSLCHNFRQFVHQLYSHNEYWSPPKTSTFFVWPILHMWWANNATGKSTGSWNEVVKHITAGCFLHLCTTSYRRLSICAWTCPVSP